MNKPPLSKLFLTFLKIGAFTFGGGYAMLPLIREAVVDKEKWLTDDGFLDMIGITQSVPGVLAVNAAVFIGYQLAGVPGALLSAVGAVLPSFLIILFIAAFLIHFSGNVIVNKAFTGIRSAVVALIAYAVIKLGRKTIRGGFDRIVAGGALILAYFLGVNPVLVILAAAVAGLVYSYFPRSGGMTR